MKCAECNLWWVDEGRNIPLATQTPTGKPLVSMRTRMKALLMTAMTPA